MSLRLCALALAVMTVAFVVVATAARAQVIRGTVRTQLTEVAVPSARVTATDSADKVLAEAMSDAAGRFTFVLAVTGPIRVNVRKVGWVPSSTDWLKLKVTDTLDFDFMVPADPVGLTPVEVTAAANTFNARAYDEAKRKGWKIVSPELVERYRNTSSNFLDMLRASGVGVRVRNSADCIRSIRTDRCLVYVVDGMPVGAAFIVNPRDVYFFAVLSSTESAVQWGDRAPWGAIVVYTRMAGDRRRP